jgi:hypothetical protein
MLCAYHETLLRLISQFLNNYAQFLELLSNCPISPRSLSVASQKIEEKREKKVVRMENIIIVRRKY